LGASASTFGALVLVFGVNLTFLLFRWFLGILGTDLALCLPNDFYNLLVLEFLALSLEHFFEIMFGYIAFIVGIKMMERKL
jgi:hypothetical protein